MGYEERRCWANCVRFSTWGPHTARLQTDGRTDTRITCNCKTTLCSIDSIVHHMVKQRQNSNIADFIGIADNVSKNTDILWIKQERLANAKVARDTLGRQKRTLM